MPRTTKAATGVKKTPRTSRVRKTTVKPAVATVRTSPLRPVKRTYIFAVGRRKEAVARVRWYLGPVEPMIVNERPVEDYFPTKELQQLVKDPLVLTDQEGQGRVTAKVAGGGTQGQAEAVRLGVSRALVQMDPDLRIALKRAGFLRRDPRVKERKKYGLKRARRAPQWQKR